MESATSSEASRCGRLRVCSVSGGVGAGMVLVAFFLPWVRIDPATAADFGRAVEERLADGTRPPMPAGDDWRRLARIVEQQHVVTGLDVFYWARTAVQTSTTAGDGPAARAARGLRVAAVGLGALPGLSLLLLLYFLLRHSHRSRSPALILAMWVGAAGIGTAALVDVVNGALSTETSIDHGVSVLLLGSALLFLAGAFGVKAQNWWRVFAGALALAGITALGIATYLRL